MWDLKLLINDFFFYTNFLIQDLIFNILNAINPLLQNGLIIFNSTILHQFSQNMTFFFAIKFCISISFLVLIRGGTPRYRYDYLTKLGWLKFLSFIIFIFFSSILTFFIL